MIGALAGAATLGAARYRRERGLRRTARDGGRPASRIARRRTAEFEVPDNDFSLCSKKIRMFAGAAEYPVRRAPRRSHRDRQLRDAQPPLLAVNGGVGAGARARRTHPAHESHDILLTRRGIVDPDRPRPTRDAARASCSAGSTARPDGRRPDAGAQASAGNCVPRLTVPLFGAMIRDIPVRTASSRLLFHWLEAAPIVFLV